MAEFNVMTRAVNIDRIPYAAALVILFRAIGIPDLLPLNLRGLWLWMIITAGVNLLFALCARIFSKKLKCAAKSSTVFIFAFWVSVILLSLPFMTYDIEVNVPFNLALTAFLLVVMPIFSPGQSACVFGFLFTAGLAADVVFGASTGYILCSSLIILGSLSISGFIQYRYVLSIADLRRASSADPLTGILNRRSGIDKIVTVLELCKRHSLCAAVYMIDIDDFKGYNDTYGHMAGDTALCRTARTISSVFARQSDVVCRYGGEEFLVCGVVRNESEAQEMAERLRLAVYSMFIPNKSSAADVLTVSIGCGFRRFSASAALFTSEREMIALADSALYVAKGRGKNQVELSA